MDTIRCYYRCNEPGCQVKKQVEKAAWQSNKEANVRVTGVHNHPERAVASAKTKGDVGQLLMTLPSQQKKMEPIPTPPMNLALAQEVRMASPHFVIADPQRPDCPIVFASPGFCTLTGYSLSECVGRNCRFLQGKDTNRNAISQISMACKLQKEISIILLNFKKDRTPFWNLLTITPVHDLNGNLVSFVGVQLDVSQRRATAPPPNKVPGGEFQ